MIALGKTEGGELISVPVGVRAVLLAGTSGGGKTTLVTGFVERLLAQSYQCCILDPEGDYEGIAGAISLGGAGRTPNLDQIAEAVKAGGNVVISLLAVPQADRPTYAQRVFARINDVHVSVGRPHWLFVDEAHHALPVPSNTLAPIDFGPSVFLITTRPELIAPSALASVEVVIAVGDDPGGTISSTRTILGETEPASEITLDHAHTGTAVVWKRSAPEQQLVIATASPTGERRRHIRKYAEGELAPEKSFYFKGPENKQNRRAQNLMTFIALADGIDDETWLHHLKQHDYSN